MKRCPTEPVQPRTPTSHASVSSVQVGSHNSAGAPGHRGTGRDEGDGDAMAFFFWGRTAVLGGQLRHCSRVVVDRTMYCSLQNSRRSTVSCLFFLFFLSLPM